MYFRLNLVPGMSLTWLQKWTIFSNFSDAVWKNVSLAGLFPIHGKLFCLSADFFPLQCCVKGIEVVLNQSLIIWFQSDHFSLLHIKRLICTMICQSALQQPSWALGFRYQRSLQLPPLVLCLRIAIYWKYEFSKNIEFTLLLHKICAARF